MEYQVPTLCLDILNQTHCLIAGCTGSGKSVLLNSVLYTALRAGNKHLMLIDPKRVELKQYTQTPVTIAYACELDDSVKVLDKAIDIMEKRYNYMAKRGLKSTDGDDIYLCIDELADLLISDKRRDVIKKLQRLLQLGRASGIHIIACTQVPNRRIIPAELTLNFTAKVGLHTDQRIESRQIINDKGCEDLPMFGYGLYKKPSAKTELWEIPLTEDSLIHDAIIQNKQLNRHIQPFI